MKVNKSNAYTIVVEIHVGVWRRCYVVPSSFFLSNLDDKPKTTITSSQFEFPATIETAENSKSTVLPPARISNRGHNFGNSLTAIILVVRMSLGVRCCFLFLFTANFSRLVRERCRPALFGSLWAAIGAHMWLT